MHTRCALPASGETTPYFHVCIILRFPSQNELLTNYCYARLFLISFTIISITLFPIFAHPLHHATFNSFFSLPHITRTSHPSPLPI